MARWKRTYFSQYDPAKDTCVICGTVPTQSRNFCHRCYQRVLNNGQVENPDLQDILQKVFPERLESGFVDKKRLAQDMEKAGEAAAQALAQRENITWWPDFGDDGDPCVIGKSKSR